MAAMQQGAPSASGPQEAQQEGDPHEQALMQAIMQVDQGIGQLAQALKSEDLGKLNMQFRQIVKAIVGGGEQQEPQEPQRADSGMAPAQSAGRSTQMAM